MPELETKSNREITILSGAVKIEPIKRTDKNGNDYYFTFLITEEGKEQVIFFFDIPYHLIFKIEELKEGGQVTVEGFYNNRDGFTVKEIRD
jgi:hypothetical protein